jgi:hypothetical protein
MPNRPTLIQTTDTRPGRTARNPNLNRDSRSDSDKPYSVPAPSPGAVPIWDGASAGRALGVVSTFKPVSGVLALRIMHWVDRS